MEEGNFYSTLQLSKTFDVSGRYQYKSQGHEVNGITLRVNFPQGAIHTLCFASKSAIGQQGFANYYRLCETWLLRPQKYVLFNYTCITKKKILF